MQLKTSETTYRDFGALHIRIDRHDEGVSINVIGHPALDRQFLNDDLGAGRTYLTFLRDTAQAGIATRIIEEQAGVLTSATAAMTDADAELIADINATLDQAPTAQPVDVSDIDGTGWNAMRQQARKLHNTRTQQYLKPPTAAQLRLMRQHDGGIVRLDGRANWTTLRALVDRKLADIHEVHGRHIIASVRLNARGLAAVGQTPKEIAA